MSLPSNNRHWRKITRRLPLLMAVAAGLALHGAQAATIYQCKQANGKVAFQEMPCASSEAESVVTPAIRAVSPKTAPASAPASSAAETSSAAVCRQTGVNVFDPTLPQGLQHPQAAFNLCKKTLPEPMNINGLCLDACVQAWVGEYKKTYVDQ